MLLSADRADELGSLIIFYTHEFEAVAKSIAVFYFCGDSHARLSVSAKHFDYNVVSDSQIRLNLCGLATFAFVIPLAVNSLNLHT